MEKVEKLGSAKRFGVRYGSKPKHEFAKIEKEQRKKHKCPYCSAIKVKRVSVGIWQCRRCNAKFTGKAYSVSKVISFKKEPEAAEKEIMEEKEPMEEGIEKEAE